MNAVFLFRTDTYGLVLRVIGTSELSHHDSIVKARLVEKINYTLNGHIRRFI
jgi:hypothetical protein